VRKCQNRQVIAGWMGKDPKMSYLKNDNIKATFSVATKFSWQNKKTQKWEESTEWFQVECWKYLAKRVEKWFRKGLFVHVEGPTQTKRWKGDDGTDHEMKVIKAADLWVLDRLEGAPPALDGARPAEGPATDSGGQVDENEDLPF